MSGLDQFALTDTAILELTNPVNGGPLLFDDPKGEKDENGNIKQIPITISLLRSDGKEASEHSHQLQNRRLSRMGKKGKLKITAAELEEDSLSLLVFCTRGWSGIDVGGVELTCNAGNVRSLYSDKRFTWIRSQVDEFIGDEARFLGNSLKS
jgi:hypothetical protein